MKHHLFSDSSTGLNFVAIGGGNGLSTLLSGLKRFVAERETEPIWLENLSAIVAVTDDACWADVMDNGDEEVVQLPTALLNVLN